MKKLITICLVAATVLVATGNQASAIVDTIEAAYVAVDAGGQESLFLNGQPNSGANGIMAMHTQNAIGSLASLISTPNAWAYCYELGAYADFPYAVHNVSTLAAAIGNGKAGLISQLWAQHYNQTWQSSTPIYYGGNQGGFVNGQPANTLENQEALAMNFSIYEISYDFDGTLGSLNLAGGIFAANAGGTNPSAAVGIAGNWLSNLVMPENYTGPLAQLLALTHSTQQDIIVEVPEPATIALLGLGALSLIRRKK